MHFSANHRSPTARRDRLADELTGLATRSVDLLRLIEDTVGTLRANTDVVLALARAIEAGISGVAELGAVGGQLDPQREVAPRLEAAALIAQRHYERAEQALRAAQADYRLDESDGVEAGWRELAEALADFHDLLGELRERIQTRDALLSPRDERTYTDIDELFDAIGR